MVRLMNQWKDLTLAGLYNRLEPVFDGLLNVRLAYVYASPIS